MVDTRRSGTFRTMRLLLPTLLALVACRSEKDYYKNLPSRVDAGPEELRPAPAGATLLATGQNSPRALQVLGDSVFWLNQGGRPVGAKGVFSVPGRGGAVSAHTSGASDILAMAADSAAVYWLAPREGKIVRVPRGGGEEQVLAETTGISRGLVIDDADVFWAENEAIYAVPKAGGKVRTVSPAGIPDYVALDDTYVYWYSTVSGVLFRAPKKGAPRPTKVYADEKHTLHFIFLDGNDLFVSYGPENAMVIQRLPKAGGTPVTVVEKQQPGSDFAIDGAHIYWITDDDVWMVPRSGGEASKAVEKLVHGVDVAVDDQFIYWSDRTRIQKMAKK